MKNLKYITIKCSLNQFCKNNVLKIKEVALNVNKNTFEDYALAKLDIIHLLH
jgi:hypothetical protein